MATLSGVRALVTRPEPQASELVQAIQAKNGCAVAMPMLSIDPLPETQASKDIVLDLDRFDKVIVISRPAAQQGLSYLENYWPQFPLHLQWFAIGRSTAAEMAEFLIQPKHTELTENSEALLALQELNTVKGERCLIIKGQGGRTLLFDALTQRGANVTLLNVYSRQRVSYPHQQLTHWLESQQINVILSGSGETVHHLGYYLPQHQRSHYSLIVPSQRVADQAIALGFQRVINANGANHNAMLSALSNIVKNPSEDPS